LLPAMRVLRTLLACSAGTFSNLIVIIGCSLWKSAANFFIVGWLPTQEKNVTVVGSVGSLTTPSPSPWVVSPELFASSPPQAASAVDAIRNDASTASAFADL